MAVVDQTGSVPGKPLRQRLLARPPHRKARPGSALLLESGDRLHAHHADLNSHNVLISAAQKAWLIDWDKGHIEAGIGHWCERVLDRLQRSLRKECPDVPESEIIVGMKQLREAHEAGLQA